MIFSDDCQNGNHFLKWPLCKYKQCIYLIFGGFLCAIHALIGIQGQRIDFFYTFKLKMMFIFQNDGNIKYILTAGVNFHYIFPQLQDLRSKIK